MSALPETPADCPPEERERVEGIHALIELCGLPPILRNDLPEAHYVALIQRLAHARHRAGLSRNAFRRLRGAAATTFCRTHGISPRELALGRATVSLATAARWVCRCKQRVARERLERGRLQ